MKKALNKIILVVVAVLMAAALCITFTACSSPADGKSAYEIAVDHGFEGSEEEWLESLKGARGAKGSNGEDGRSKVFAEPVITVAHRGYNKTAPENTLSAFRLAKEKGFNYVETDIRFTKDGVPVLLHDATIDRTTGTANKTNITSLTLEQVRKFDFGSWKSAEYAGEKIPTFEEFLDLCRGLELHPFIELVDGGVAVNQVEMLVNMVKEHGMLRNCTWVAFKPELLREVTRLDEYAELDLAEWQCTASTVATAVSLRNGKNKVILSAAWLTGSADGGILKHSDVQLAIDADLPLLAWETGNLEGKEPEIDILALDPYIQYFCTNGVNAAEVLYEAAMKG